MKETIEAIQTALKERVGNQVVGTFALVWLLFNWPIFVLLWKSQQSIEITIQKIFSEWLTFEYALWRPAAFTLFYILAYPWLSFASSVYSDWANRRAISARQKSEVDLLKGKKDLFEVEAELDMIKAVKKHELEMRLKQADAEIRRLEREETAKQERQEREIQVQREAHAKQIEEFKKSEDRQKEINRERSEEHERQYDAKRKIDQELELKEYRLQKEVKLRQKYGEAFDQTP